MPADASVRSTQKVLHLGAVIESYPKPVAELIVSDGEMMLSRSSGRRLLHDQLTVLPAAMRWLRRVSVGVEEPPEDRRRRSRRDHLNVVDHEHSVSRELLGVRPHLPVVLQHDLTTDVQLEDDHRPRRCRRGPR